MIALAAAERMDIPPAAPVPYLVESRWQVEGLAGTQQRFTFRARGFGRGEMTWKVDSGGTYRIVVDDGERQIESFAEADAEGLLGLALGGRRNHPASVAVHRLAGG